MKRLYFFSAMFSALCMLAPMTVYAYDLTINNKTDQELFFLGVRSIGGERGKHVVSLDNLTTLPEQKYTLQGLSGTIQEITLESGVETYKFENLTIEDGGPFNLIKHDGKVFLAPENMSNEEFLAGVDSKGQGAAGTSEPQSIDVDAGPIWNNDHARERCPEIVEVWLSENSGMKAEWTGNWVTRGDTSYCNLRIESEAPARDNAGSEIVQASVVKMIQDSTEVSIEQAMAARTEDDLKALGAVPTSRARYIALTVNFAGMRWVGFYYTNLDGQVQDVRFYTYAEDATKIADAINSVSGMGYRPWQTEADDDYEETTGYESVHFWEDERYAQQAQAEEMLIEKLNSNIYSSDSPAAANTVFFTSDGWAKAAAGENTTDPCLNLRVTSAKNMTLLYHPDASSSRKLNWPRVRFVKK